MPLLVAVVSGPVAGGDRGQACSAMPAAERSAAAGTEAE
jgi:hypothetical protein